MNEAISKTMEERWTKLQEEMFVSALFGACTSTVEQPKTSFTIDDILKAIEDVGPPPPVIIGPGPEGEYYAVERELYDKMRYDLLYPRVY